MEKTRRRSLPGGLIAAALALVAALLLCLPATAWAEATNDCPGGDACTHQAAIGTTHYSTLQEAVNAATSGATVTVLDDVTLNDGKIEIDKKLTVDLNKHTVSGSGTNVFLTKSAADVVLKNGVVKVTSTSQGAKGLLLQGGNAVVSDMEIQVKAPESEGYNYAAWVTAFEGETAKDINATFTNVKISEIANSSIAGERLTVGIGVIGAGFKSDAGTPSAKLTINNSSVNVSGFAIAGNGSKHGTDVVINDSTLESTSVAIYHPQSGNMTINGGSVTGGSTGIEVRAGNVTINRTTVVGNGSSVTTEPNGNGTTSDGAGIAIAQHTTGLPINVTVNESSTIKGYSAIYESNVQNSTPENLKKVSINLKGGDFSAINGGTNAVYSQDVKNFISGGVYTNVPSSGYLAADVAVISDGKNFTVDSEESVKENAAASITGADGQTIYYTTVDAAEKVVAGTTGKVEVLKYTVTYVIDENNSEKVLAPAGEVLAKPADPAKVEGWTFAGWFTEKDGDKLSNQYKFDTPVTSDLTLYAGWTEDDPAAGEGEEPKGDSADKPKDDSKTESKAEAALPQTGDNTTAVAAGIVGFALVAVAGLALARRRMS